MSDFTKKVRAMLDAIPVGHTVIATDMDDACLALFNAAPTLLREACERIEALEKVAEAAKEWDTAYSLSGKLNAAVRLRNALSALDAADTGEK